MAFNSISRMELVSDVIAELRYKKLGHLTVKCKVGSIRHRDMCVKCL